MTAALKTEKPITEKVRIARLLERARKEATPRDITIRALAELADLGSVDELRQSRFHCEGAEDYFDLAVRRAAPSPEVAALGDVYRRACA